MTLPAERLVTSDLLDRLRYQVMTPQVTTMGPCPTCDGSSRGAGECADCLLDRLPTGTRQLAREWVRMQRQANRQRWALVGEG